MSKFSPFVIALVLTGCILTAADSGPNDRKATDPKSIVSAVNANAKQASVEDLFVSRILYAAALFPDGSAIALTTEYFRTLLGDPEKDRKVYEEDSPIHYIHELKAPLLVFQGDKDPRVPKEEAEQLVVLLKKRGNVVEAVYYPNEGHGFDKVENQIDSARRTVEWCDKYLKGQPASKN